MSPIFCCLDLIAKIKKAKDAKGLDSDEEDTGGGGSDVNDEN